MWYIASNNNYKKKAKLMRATVQIETISPKLAREYLQDPVEGQRKLGERHVRNICKDMSEGRFVLSCDAIVLIKGKLGNGQHRLEAVSRTGKAQDFLVMRTDDDALFEIIDSGKNRKIADVLYGDGIENGTRLAAIARQILIYDYGSISEHGNSFPNVELENIVTRTDVLEFVRVNKDDLDPLIQFAFPLYNKSERLYPITLSCALLYIASRNKKNIEKVKEFIQLTYTGSSDLSCPARIIRERLIKNASSKAKLNRQYIFALLIKGYNFFLSGEKPKFIKMAENEDYPIITV